jgi:hypothetical protein
MTTRVTAQSNATVQPDDLVDPPGAGPGPIVAGGIVSLNPADGLFLQAEHLTAIEDYTRALSHALGVAGGTGVVYGYGITLHDASLEVTAGLAIDPAGRVLRSASTAVVSLAAQDLPEVEPDGFWVIEVGPANWPQGNAPVYGTLCADPCSGSSISPYLVEGVRIALRPDVLAGLGSTPSDQRRNWLASRYYERERAQSEPWLVPGRTAGLVDKLLGHDWTETPAAANPAAVPLGILQLVNGSWLLDVWAARRDIGGPPATISWQGHLAMRPWNVFLAQVLQFQNELSVTSGLNPELARHQVVNERDAVFERFRDEVREKKQLANWRIIKEFLAGYQAAPEPYMVVGKGGSLISRGIGELPPAGFLQVGTSRKTITATVRALFEGSEVELRFCQCRADFVPHAIEQSQHLDRIPLKGEYGAAQVDILVPTEPADLAATRAENYGWVAFVRRRACDCGGRTDLDEVDVHFVALRSDIELLRLYRSGKLQLGPAEDTLKYPPGGWAYPGGVTVDLLETWCQQTPEVGQPLEQCRISLLAVASDATRRPLAALRAALLAASFDDQLAPPPVIADVPDKLDRELIVVAVTPRAQAEQPPAPPPQRPPG